MSMNACSQTGDHVSTEVNVTTHTVALLVPAPWDMRASIVRRTMTTADPTPVCMGALVTTRSMATTVCVWTDSLVKTVPRTLMSVDLTLAIMEPPVETMSTLTHVNVHQDSVGHSVWTMIMTAQPGKIYCKI